VCQAEAKWLLKRKKAARAIKKRKKTDKKAVFCFISAAVACVCSFCELFLIFLSKLGFFFFLSSRAWIFSLVFFFFLLARERENERERKKVCDKKKKKKKERKERE
jgi:arginine exporter protein ArgO